MPTRKAPHSAAPLAPARPLACGVSPPPAARPRPAVVPPPPPPRRVLALPERSEVLPAYPGSHRPAMPPFVRSAIEAVRAPRPAPSAVPTPTPTAAQLAAARKLAQHAADKYMGLYAPARIAGRGTELRVEMFSAPGKLVVASVSPEGVVANGVTQSSDDRASWATVEDVRFRLNAAANPFVQKPVPEPWQRRRDDYVASGLRGLKTDRKRGELELYHRHHVFDALRSRWPVPDAVLADYPGMREAYGPGAAYERPGADATPETADLIVAHTHEHGTTIRTRLPDDRRFNEAIKAQRAGFKWWPEGKRYYRINSIGTPAPTIDLERLAEGLRLSGASVYVQPVAAVAVEEADAVKRAHLEERGKRYESRAAAAREELAEHLRGRAPMAAPSRAVPDDVMGVLRRAVLNGNALSLPQVDAKLYKRVNEVLESIGAEWNRKAKAHVFKRDDARESFEALVSGGRFSTAKDLGYFPTPAALADELVESMGVSEGMSVLEPSAGEGALVAAALARGARVTAVEFDAGRAERLKARFPNVRVIVGDFLAMTPAQLGMFDAVVMNPPFSLDGMPQADIDHVTHATRFVRPQGSVAAIMSRSVAFRDNAKTAAFREMVERNLGHIAEIDDGAFKASGTAVNTAMVTMRMQRESVDDDDKKGRQLKRYVEHLEGRSESRAEEARRYTSSTRDALEAVNGWTDALVKLMAANLKRDLGADRVTRETDATVTGGMRASFSVRLPLVPNQSYVRVERGEVKAGPYDASLRGPAWRTVATAADAPEAAYAAVVAAMPHGSPVDASAPIGDPKLFQEEFIRYAMRRLKRDTGAYSVDDSRSFQMGGNRWLRVVMDRRYAVQYGVEPDGFNVSVTSGQKSGEWKTDVTYDARGLSVPEVYAKVRGALPQAK